MGLHSDFTTFKCNLSVYSLFGVVFVFVVVVVVVVCMFTCVHAEWVDTCLCSRL